MSWATYEPYVGMGGGMGGSASLEPIQSLKPEAPQASQQFQSNSAPPLTPHQASAPQKQYAPGSKNVPVPASQEQGSKWKDISDYYEVSDWLFIGLAVLLVDLFVLFLVRYFPDVFGKAINIWYNRFKLSAVISDVFIIMIGFGIARYIYTEYIYPKYDWNAAYFTGTAVIVQIIHDVLFYFGVIKPITPGHNAMMDVFKTYAESGGAKVIAADSAMMIASSFFSMALKAAPAHITVFIGLIAAYVLPYILETRNEYSGVA
jgi:hypothetical protein